MLNINIYILLVLIFFCSNCYESSKKVNNSASTAETNLVVKEQQNFSGTTVQIRIKTPSGFERSLEDINSFQEYLRNLKLKPHGSLVNYYNGSVKNNYDVYEAVIDLEIGTKDLHQCADAVMRLRAEYLWAQKEYDKIHFNFTNGYKVEYKKWMSGMRMNINGNRTWWSQKSAPSNTYADFWNYMELIFTYAGTASLEKELKTRKVEEAEIGDVLIQGGHPGHAVIIIDKAVNNITGDKIYLLAQSYMPAQEIHVLQNPTNTSQSPWYTLENGEIETPEWSFNSTDLKRFEE